MARKSTTPKKRSARNTATKPKKGDAPPVAIVQQADRPPPPELAGLFAADTLLTAGQVEELQAVVAMIRQKDNGRAIERLNHFFKREQMLERLACAASTPSANPPTRADQLTALRAECLRVAQVCQHLTSAGVPADWPTLIRGLQRRATAEAEGGRIPPLFPMVATTEQGALEQLVQLHAWIDSEEQRLVAPPKAIHSLDFSYVRWFGEEFFFTGTQAAVVAVLWDQWERGTPDVRHETLLDLAESEGKKLANIFKGCRAWNTLIQTVGAKGTCRLVEPEKKF